jgi:hypothetical protein
VETAYPITSFPVAAQFIEPVLPDRLRKNRPDAESAGA